MKATASTSEKKTFPAIPAALLSMVSVQCGASIAKQLFSTLGASGTSSLRIGLSALLLYIFNRPKLSLLTKKQWFYCMLYGLCLGVMNLVFYLGIQRIPLGLGTALEFTGPLAIALVYSRKTIDFLWITLACLGILLIVPWQNNGIDALGVLFSLMAGVCWACYILLGKKLTKTVKTGDAVTIGMCFATLFILPIGIISGEFSVLSWKLALIGLGVGLFSSAIPYSLDLIALKKLSSKTFSILLSLHPAFGALAGLIFLNEILSTTQWMSILCVVLASVGVTTFSSKKHEK